MRLIALLAFILLACTARSEAAATVVAVADGEDWSVASSPPAANSGFFHEHASPEVGIETRVIDVSWRQLEPHPGQYVTDLPLASTPSRYETLDFARSTSNARKEAHIGCASG